ncbi:MAG: deoxyribodipyrimidine photo-lyase [Kiritimatiellae bacterium]|nr:deoxyribodipyrimidine photo-lyase [Kiritimatiellia bacterium]
MVEPERVAVLNPAPERPDGRYVLYWMQQSQRAEWNPALARAIEHANRFRRPVVVGFALTPSYPDANARHYCFMLEGLEEVRRTLQTRGIGWVLRIGDPPEVIAALASEAVLVVTDRGYMPVQVAWRRELAARVHVRLEQVEGDVVVPVETASDHEEYAARTLRPKIHRHRARFLTPFAEPEVAVRCDAAPVGEVWTNTGDLLRRLRVDGSVAPSTIFHGGTSEARRRLRRFIAAHLGVYPELRNDPTAGAQSELSPYLHFGQISPVEVARAVLEAEAPRAAKEAFLEELIVRRELSMNFARYNPRCQHYDALPAWARATLAAHAGDPRPHVYTLEQWEAAATHDPAWNAAQREMVITGKMHNYMRMYWGKKILEWSRSPEEAFAIALRLNDRYELDGRDPNSCAGVAWCFGKHDRPWAERPVFGTVRYMSAAGLHRKFDVEEYIRRWRDAPR